MENKVGVNIWDDYYEDEIGETYAYVESGSDGNKTDKYILEFVMNYLKDFSILDNVEMNVSYYNSETRYDSETVKRCKIENGEDFFYKRYQIFFKGLTHEIREELIDLLLPCLYHNGNKIEIYSES